MALFSKRKITQNTRSTVYKGAQETYHTTTIPPSPQPPKPPSSTVSFVRKTMTTYGTIPTSSSLGTSANLEYSSRAKERIKEGLATQRPWKVMLDYHFFKLPSNFQEALARLRTNIAYFHANYAIIVLIILFLSLLWLPISLIVFIVMAAAWLFLYFLRDDPLVVLGRTIDDRVVLIVLSVLTIVFLLLTNVTLNVLVSIFTGVVVVLVHGVTRKTDDLFIDEEASGLMSTPSAS